MGVKRFALVWCQGHSHVLEELVDEFPGLLFTGCDTWNFAATDEGCLRTELSDGHVHIQPWLCGPVHDRLVERLVGCSILA